MSNPDRSLALPVHLTDRIAAVIHHRTCRRSGLRRLSTRRYALVALLAPLALAPGARVAAANRSDPLPDAPTARLVSVVTHGSVRLVSTFPGPAANIVGVIGRDRSGKRLMAWVVDGKYLATGPLFTIDGENLTLAAARSHDLVATPPSAGDLARAAMAAKGFIMGRRGPLLVAFEDPSCIYCHALSQEAAPLLAGGKLRLKVIPVGFLKSDSARKSAAVLAAPRPSEAWARNEARFNDATEDGGIAPAPAASPQLATVRQNTALLARTGALGTPLVLVCRGGADRPTVLAGFTPGTLASVIRGAGSLGAGGGCLSPRKG